MEEIAKSNNNGKNEKIKNVVDLSIFDIWWVKSLFAFIVLVLVFWVGIQFGEGRNRQHGFPMGECPMSMRNSNEYDRNPSINQNQKNPGITQQGGTVQNQSVPQADNKEISPETDLNKVENK